MAENRQLFDVTRQVEIKLQSCEGSKIVTVRFPTDEEWIERQRTRRIIIKQLGRGMSETIVPESEESDAELLTKIRIGDGPELDAFEAAIILEQLGQADVDDAVSETTGFRIFLRVPGAVTSHVLRMPSAKDIIQFRRAFVRMLDLPFNKQRLTVNLGTAGQFYSKLMQENAGYAGAVPIIHQAAAVKAVIDMVESGFGVADQENF